MCFQFGKQVLLAEWVSSGESILLVGYSKLAVVGRTAETGGQDRTVVVGV